MKKIEYFDYQRVAKETKVPPAVLMEIEQEVKKDFPSDRMMYELHVLRAVKSKYWEGGKSKKAKRRVTNQGRTRKDEHGDMRKPLEAKTETETSNKDMDLAISTTRLRKALESAKGKGKIKDIYGRNV